MTRYIQTGSATGKAQTLEKAGAKIIERPASLDDVPEDESLICVAENPGFDAATVVEDERDFNEFKRGAAMGDPRPKTWLLMATENVNTLTAD